jgi:ribosomal protein S18 acetylase RimI-like enzyme
MICKAMELFKAAGFEYATLGVDTENTSGALAIYERLGFASVCRNLMYEKTITIAVSAVARFCLLACRAPRW